MINYLSAIFLILINLKMKAVKDFCLVTFSLLIAMYQ